jgi:hypothetical protein
MYQINQVTNLEATAEDNPQVLRNRLERVGLSNGSPPTTIEGMLIEELL